MQRDQRYDTPGGFKSPRADANIDSANDDVTAATSSVTEGANAAPLRAATHQRDGSSGVAVAGPTVGGTAAPYDPVKVERAKEHLAESLNSAADNNNNNNDDGDVKTHGQMPSISDTVLSGATSAATGAAAAAAGVISVAKRLIGGQDDDTDDSDYADSPTSPAKDTTTTAAKGSPSIKPNSDHGLEFKGEKKPMNVADRQCEKTNVIAHTPSVKATHGAAEGAKAPSGPLPGNMKPGTPTRMGPMPLGDPFGPVTVANWSDFRHERETSTPSSDDFEREDYDRTHPFPSDGRSHSAQHTDNHAGTAAIIAAASAGATHAHPIHAPSPLKDSVLPLSSSFGDDEDYAVRREHNVKDSTPQGGMNVDRPLDTSFHRQRSATGLNVDISPESPAHHRASNDRVGGMNVDRAQDSPSDASSRGRRPSRGLNVDRPLESATHGGSGSSENPTSETARHRPSGTYNSAYNVDRPGSSGNKQSALGVDSPAKSTYDIKPAAQTSRPHTTSDRTEPIAAVVGAASAVNAAPPLHDTVHVGQGDTESSHRPHHDSDVHDRSTSNFVAGTAAPGTAAAATGRSAGDGVKEAADVAENSTKGAAEAPKENLHLGSYQSHPTIAPRDMVPHNPAAAASYPHADAPAVSGGGVGNAVKEAVGVAENSIKGAAEALKEKLHLGSYQSHPTIAPRDMVPRNPAAAATYPHADAPAVSGGGAAAPTALSSTNSSTHNAPPGDYHDVEKLSKPESVVDGVKDSLHSMGNKSESKDIAHQPSSTTSGTATTHDQSASVPDKVAIGVAAVGTAAATGARGAGHKVWDAIGSVRDKITGDDHSSHHGERPHEHHIPRAHIGAAAVPLLIHHHDHPHPHPHPHPADEAGKTAAGGTGVDAANKGVSDSAKDKISNQTVPDSKVSTASTAPAGRVDNHSATVGSTSLPQSNLDNNKLPSATTSDARDHPTGITGKVATAAATGAATKGADESVKDTTDTVKNKVGDRSTPDNKETTKTTHTGPTTSHVDTPSERVDVPSDHVSAPPAHFDQRFQMPSTTTTTLSLKTTPVHKEGGGLMDKVKSIFRGGDHKDEANVHSTTTPSSRHSSDIPGRAAAGAAAAGATTAAANKGNSGGSIKDKASGWLHRRASVPSTTSATATPATPATTTTTGNISATAPRLDEIKLASNTPASGCESPHLTSSGLPKADLHATPGVPATKLDAHPTSTINKAYHVSSPKSSGSLQSDSASTTPSTTPHSTTHTGDSGKLAATSAALAAGATDAAATSPAGHSSATPHLSSITTQTTYPTTTTQTQGSNNVHVSSAAPGQTTTSTTTTTEAPDNYSGPVPQTGPGEEVVWMKTVTTTTYYDDDGYTDVDANQEGMNEYYGRRNSGGWVGPQQSPDKGKQRI